MPEDVPRDCVPPDSGMRMEVRPQEATGRRGIFHVTFLNTQRWPVLVTLAVRDREDALRVRVRPATPTAVPAGGTASITVAVAPEAPVMPHASPAYDIEFRGLYQSTTGPLLREVTSTARFTYVPHRPAAWRAIRLRGARAMAARLLLLLWALASPGAMAGRVTRTGQVRAREDPAIQAAPVAALAVRTGGLDMDVQPVEAVGRRGVFCITFLNQMNRPVSVALAARDHETGLRFRIACETPVVVPAGGVADPITVHVVPKVRALLGAPHSYEIEFQAVELGGEDESTPSLVERARFVYVPRYTARRLPAWLRRGPGWTLLLPLVLLLLLVHL